MDSKKSIQLLFKYWYFLLGVPVFFITKYFYRFDPENSNSIFLKCPFLFLTGFYCPGCGSQRAIHDLVHFRIGDALDHNLMFVFVFLTIVGKAFAIISKKYFPNYYYDLTHNSKFTYILVVFVFVFSICRNIPVTPFSYLAP